jgi:hypothetical protein
MSQIYTKFLYRSRYVLSWYIPVIRQVYIRINRNVTGTEIVYKVSSGDIVTTAAWRPQTGRPTGLAAAPRAPGRCARDCTARPGAPPRHELGNTSGQWTPMNYLPQSI